MQTRASARVRREAHARISHVLGSASHTSAAQNGKARGDGYEPRGLGPATWPIVDGRGRLVVLPVRLKHASLRVRSAHRSPPPKRRADRAHASTLHAHRPRSRAGRWARRVGPPVPCGIGGVRAPVWRCGAHLALRLKVDGRVEKVGAEHATMAAGVGWAVVAVRLLDPLVEGRRVRRDGRVHRVERHLGAAAARKARKNEAGAAGAGVPAPASVNGPWRPRTPPAPLSATFRTHPHYCHGLLGLCVFVFFVE